MYVHFVRTNQIRPCKVVPGSWWVLLATCPVLPLRMRMHVCGLYVHFVRTSCLCSRTAPKRRSLFRSCLYGFVRTFCTDVLYGHCGGATRRRNALGKPSFGFPRPFPRLETTQKKFQGFELSLITASAVPRSFALRLSVTVGREGWALCVYLNFVVHFIYSVSVI